jgi:hypothetical protein
LNLTRTIGVTIYCYEINFIVTSKSRALMKQLIVIDQLWHLVRMVVMFVDSKGRKTELERDAIKQEMQKEDRAGKRCNRDYFK